MRTAGSGVQSIFTTKQFPDPTQHLHRCLAAYGFHRIVMSAAVGAALLGREAVIEGAEAVAKSYPAFFAEFIRLGGGADVL